MILRGLTQAFAITALFRRSRFDAGIGRASAQSLVEFALILLVFLMLLMGIIDLGRGVMAQNSLSHAAREGAHAGLFKEHDVAEVRTAVAKQIGLAAGLDGVTAEVSYAGRDGTPNTKEAGGTVTVTVSGTFRAVTPMMNAFIPGGLPLSASAQSVVQ